ncbi:putative polyol transporter 6 [Colletotrichum spaethianum]|uniref:Polyol transporter 6 n=1 Tax=Colletotrichum spaethianum TaxID=700344 RepID=A0AA37NYH2_9PEZI|nr:putative polyol transporter 6 [Colletotrichum spaethianum]GKT43400.1 putative polyol transporter 6 [Colletotrichum spaethianum]
MYQMDTFGKVESNSGHEHSGHERLAKQARRRQINDRAVIENPLADYTDEQLEADVTSFAKASLNVDTAALLRAARVAKDIRLYDEVARNSSESAGRELPVQLTNEEKRALVRERDVPFSEKGMWTIIITVSLAAFLQGHVQASFNGSSLYDTEFGLDTTAEKQSATATGSHAELGADDWKLGAANASPFIFAAVLGCPLALPVNHYLGRKGGMVVAAFLILVSSLASAFATNWQQLFGIRLINGVGMGLKAVSTPILASETAVGFWRGTSILAWQLWVAAGMMIGFAFNLIFDTTPDSNKRLTFQLMVAAPMVPALALLVFVIWFCDESPRYLMRVSSPSHDPQRAYQILKKLRNTELQALRDIYLVHKSLEQEELLSGDANSQPAQGFISTVAGFLRQWRDLFSKRRLRNALISSSTVALAQQLCGINVLAFYSGTLFNRAGVEKRTSMVFSLGYGAVNFVFGLPAIRTIDTLGRRKWLMLTLPVMALFMLLAGVSFNISDYHARVAVVTLFILLFAAAYSPGLGPIPFTYASECFPLSHREAGAAVAIAVNLGFAGLLSVFFPRINSGLGDGGALYLFAGLNILALVLAFLLLEETKRRSLEDLDLVFAVPKRAFIRHQVFQYLPWFFKRYFLGRRMEKPSLYLDLIWGPGGDERARVGDAEAVGRRDSSESDRDSTHA